MLRIFKPKKRQQQPRQRIEHIGVFDERWSISLFPVEAHVTFEAIIHLNTLFNCDRLGQVPGLVDIQSTQNSNVIGKQLHWHNIYKRLNSINCAMCSFTWMAGSVTGTSNLLRLAGILSSPSEHMIIGFPPRAVTCSNPVLTLSYNRSLVATKKMGRFSSIRAKGPCFNSPESTPSLCMYVSSLILSAASRQVANWLPLPMISRLLASLNFCAISLTLESSCSTLNTSPEIHLLLTSELNLANSSEQQ